MGITDLFRPKWKHSDAEVRASAIRTMAADEVDTLVRVAREDVDPAVRGLAYKRINDPALLLDLARNEPDVGAREVASGRANGLLAAEALQDDHERAERALAQLTDTSALVQVATGAGLMEVARTALERINDPKGLGEVARTAKHPNLRAAAVARLEEPRILRGIAIAETHREVGLAALERMEDQGALQAVAQRAKHKAVRKRARERLGIGGGGRRDAATDRQRKKQRTVQLQLCKSIEGLTGQTNRAAAEAVMADAEAEFTRLAAQGDLDEGLRARFARACETLRQRWAQEADVARKVAQPEEEAAAVAEGRRICDSLEALEAPAATKGRLAEARVRMEGVLQTLAASPRPEDAGRAPELRERFERAATEAEARHAEWGSKADQLRDLEAVVMEAEATAERAAERDIVAKWREVAQRWEGLARQLGDVVDERLRRRFARAAELKESGAAQWAEKVRERERRGAEKLVRLCEQIEAKIATADLKTLDRLQKRAGSALKRPGPLPAGEETKALLARLGDLSRRLAARLAEVREAEQWKRWSNAAKREAVCEKLEALTSLEDRSEAARQLSRLVAEWKQAGGVAPEKYEELSTRFQAAVGQVREHCAEYFAARDQERAENLKKKEAICERAEAMQDSTEWGETARAFKALQAEWKGIGPVAKEHADALWKRFRSACDHFFGRLREEDQQHAGERQENLAAKERLCEQAETAAEAAAWLTDKEEWGEAVAHMKGLQAEWRKVGALPRGKGRELGRRFRVACDRFFGAREAQARQAGEEAVRECLALCEKLESQVAGADASRPAEEGAETAAGAADAPPQEERRGDAARPPAPAEVVAAYERFRAVENVPAERAAELWQRFCDAATPLVTADPQAYAGTPLDPAATLQTMGRLAARAERLADRIAGGDVGAGGAAASAKEEAAAGEEEADDSGAAVQMAEQLKQALDSNRFRDAETSEGDGPQNIAAELDGLVRRWSRLGPVDDEAARPLTERFEAACANIARQDAP